MSDRRKKGFYVTGTVRYKAPYDEKVHDGSLQECWSWIHTAEEWAEWEFREIFQASQDL